LAMQNWLVVGRITIFILSPFGRFGYPLAASGPCRRRTACSSGVGPILS
jgi:hypothetical protein